MGYSKERDFQIRAMKWLDENLTDGFAFHVPNENKDILEVIEGNRQGVRAGVFDIIILLPNARVLFLELKARRRGLSGGQKMFAKTLTHMAFDWALCRSIQDIYKFLVAQNVRLKVSPKVESVAPLGGKSNAA